MICDMLLDGFQLHEQTKACNTLQHTATHYNTHDLRNTLDSFRLHKQTKAFCTLYHTATRCNTHIHIYVCIYIYICKCTYVYIYIYRYTYTHIRECQMCMQQSPDLCKWIPSTEKLLILKDCSKHLRLLIAFIFQDRFDGNVTSYRFEFSPIAFKPCAESQYVPRLNIFPPFQLQDHSYTKKSITKRLTFV